MNTKIKQEQEIKILDGKTFKEAVNSLNTVVNLVLKWALDGGLTNDIE